MQNRADHQFMSKIFWGNKWMYNSHLPVICTLFAVCHVNKPHFSAINEYIYWIILYLFLLFILQTSMTPYLRSQFMIKD